MRRTSRAESDALLPSSDSRARVPRLRSASRTPSPALSEAVVSSPATAVRPAGCGGPPSSSISPTTASLAASLVPAAGACSSPLLGMSADVAPTPLPLAPPAVRLPFRPDPLEQLCDSLPSRPFSRAASSTTARLGLATLPPPLPAADARLGGSPPACLAAPPMASNCFTRSISVLLGSRRTPGRAGRCTDPASLADGTDRERPLTLLACAGSAGVAGTLALSASGPHAGGMPAHPAASLAWSARNGSDRLSAMCSEGAAAAAATAA
mmetsp:Transcript_32952/g.82806  ORF Transcript_32952/g.82806 Transcript_32952/m.82806 type:complete len:267 (-) Transcript_32952:29-829(-)